LRFAADHRAWIDVIVTADGNVSHQRYAVFQPGPAADADVRAHDAIWAYFDFVVDLGPGIDRRVFKEICRHRRGSAKNGTLVVFKKLDW
jgi:hypothetical protein